VFEFPFFYGQTYLNFTTISLLKLCHTLRGIITIDNNFNSKGSELKNRKNESKLVRTVKIRLPYATEQKQRAIKALLESYRGAVNFYIKSLWTERGKMDADTLIRLENTRLSERYKSQALKQAMEIVIGTKKSILAINKNRKRKRRIKKVPRFDGVATVRNNVYKCY
jgi:hypothetical protein